MSLIFLKPRVVGPALPSCLHYKSCQVGFPMSLSTLSLIRLWPCGAVNNGSRTTSPSVNLTTLCLFLKHLQFISGSPLPPGLEISLLGGTTLFSCLTLSYIHFSKCSMFSCNTTALHVPCPHFRIIHAFSVKPSYQAALKLDAPLHAVLNLFTAHIMFYLSDLPTNLWDSRSWGKALWNWASASCWEHAGNGTLSASSSIPGTSGAEVDLCLMTEWMSFSEQWMMGSFSTKPHPMFSLQQNKCCIEAVNSPPYVSSAHRYMRSLTVSHKPNKTK